jgi:NitT/TauT family transport system permease protein
VKKNHTAATRIRGGISILLGLIVWQVMARKIGSGNVFLPTPTESALAIVELWQRERFAQDILWSTIRVTAGATTALLVAAPLGLLIATSRVASWLFEPLIRALRFVPVSAFIPISFLLIGTNEPQKIAVLFATAFLYILPTTIDSARSVERNYVDIGRMCGFSQRELAVRVIWPRIKPRVLDSFRTALSIGWSYVLVVEITGASVGIGHTMSLGQRYIRPSVVFAGVIAVSTLGIVSDYSLKAISRLLFAWEKTLTVPE